MNMDYDSEVKFFRKTSPIRRFWKKSWGCLKSPISTQTTQIIQIHTVV